MNLSLLLVTFGFTNLNMIIMLICKLEDFENVQRLDQCSHLPKILHTVDIITLFQK